MASPQTNGDLWLKDLTKTFGDFTAVDHIDLHIPQGSFFALLGPSGCGKTTTLRMIAGLEEPTSGKVLIGDLDITYTKAYDRPVNTVFQNYALFPHMDIFENIAFGLRRRNVSDLDKKVKDVLELIQLSHLARRKPAQLSGGQQQRVALARAIVNQPAVLLLDEPLGALDLKLRREMQVELKRIQVEVGLTFIHVTHDQEEAMSMADTIAVMNNGVVEQLGAPLDLYERPATQFVASFLGQTNTLQGTVVGPDGDFTVVDTACGRLRLPRTDLTGSVALGVRPEKIEFAQTAVSGVPDGANVVEGVVTDASFIGVSTQYIVRLRNEQEIAVFEQNLLFGRRALVGDQVTLFWDPRHSFALAAQ
ncbi:MAG: ABC transporter ATP-binding protein [Actinomycetes bacterium]|jgi:spermidine/putrescine transport system ATP-binding protein